MGFVSIDNKEQGTVQTQPRTLWRHRDFLKVWIGQTISLCGSQVTLLAFPLTAILTLQASAAQVGFLQAAEYAPFLLVGLLVGVWVDRFRRRPVMIVVDIARFLLLGFVPLAALLHILSLYEMYVIAFIVGTLTIFFDVAYRSYLPSLIERDQLLDGNSKLELTASMAQLAGPGLGGILVQAFTAPFSLLIDACSFAVSAFSLLVIRTSEPPVPPATAKRRMFPEIVEGLQTILRHPIMRSVIWCSININLFTYMTTAVYILYATDTLHISPAVLGVIYALGGSGAVLGAAVNRWMTQRFGVGITMIVMLATTGFSALLVPLAAGSPFLVVTILVIAQFLTSFTTVIWNINQLCLRQGLTPDALLGRVNASFRFLAWGAIPIGSLIGGLLGTFLGLRTTLFIGTCGLILAPVWVLWSPLRALKTLPEAPAA